MGNIDIILECLDEYQAILVRDGEELKEDFVFIERRYKKVLKEMSENTSEVEINRVAVEQSKLLVDENDEKIQAIGKFLEKHGYPDRTSYEKRDEEI